MEMNTLPTASRSESEPAATNPITGHGTNGASHGSEDLPTADGDLTRDEPDQAVGPERHRTDLFARLQRWWQEDQNPDDLEERLLLHLRTTSDPDARMLLKTYRKLKGTSTGVLFNSLLAFRSMVPGQSLSDYQNLEIAEEVSFRSCLDLMKSNLNPVDRPSLQVCILSNIVPEHIRLSNYSFVSKIFASTKTLNSMHQTPLLAIFDVINNDWLLSTAAREACQAEPSPPVSIPAAVPSKVKQSCLFPLKSFEWTIINISWFRDVVGYTQDVSVYVWQPHLAPPHAVGVSICISPSDLGSLQAVIVLKPSKSSSQSLHDLLGGLRSAIPDPVKTLSGIEIEIVSTLLSIYALLIADTTVLIAKLFALVDYLTIEGRRNPSVSKIHYTLYLGDCQKASHVALSCALELLSSLSAPDGTPEGFEEAVAGWSAIIKADIHHLQSQLEQVAIQLVDLRRDIKDQLDLRQIRLSRLLTVLAAIYLPFSFVSGFFGMNVSDPLWRVPQPTPPEATSSPLSALAARTKSKLIFLGQRQVQNTTTSTAPSNITLSQNQTDSIIAAISTSGPHLFTFSTFLIVAFTLTFITIILPLVAGNIFRKVLQIADYYKRHWRVLVLLFSISTIVLTRVFIPLEVAFTYILIFGVPQVGFAIFRLYKTTLLQKRWIGYTAILSISLSYDISAVIGSGLFIGLTGIIPLTYLFVFGAMDDIAVLTRTRLPQLRTYTRIPPLITQHRKVWLWVSAAVWVALNMAVSFLPGTLLMFLTGYSIALALYGLGKIWNSQESVIKWTTYLVVIGLSAMGDYYIAQGVFLSIVPFIYLIACRVLERDQAFITAYFPEWMNHEQARRHRTSSASQVQV